MSYLTGKACLVLGFANHRSLAWGIAQASSATFTSTDRPSRMQQVPSFLPCIC